ncbi:glycosyltransferase [Selenomonas sputigena]|uniref:Glycosyltransferase n=1 Tax=Selenomonas sputigena TaxID=69823 RepID=A0ABV3X5J6_9FIRM
MGTETLRQQPTISIVLPVYNGEKYLRESLDSILGQTFADWELIAVDDCSTDSTPEILASYAARDSRIRVLRNKENQRLPRSLNIGFAEARGGFLTWTSDDNAYYPEALDKMLAYLRRFPEYAMVNADMELLQEEADGTQKRGISEYFDADPLRMFVRNYVGACFLYRRKVLEEIGGYDPEMFLLEDYDYWLRIMIRYGRIAHIKEVLYCYRLHAASLSTKKEKERDVQAVRLVHKYLPDMVYRLRHHPELFHEYFFVGVQQGEWSEEELALFRRYMPSLVEEAGL